MPDSSGQEMPLFQVDCRGSLDNNRGMGLMTDQTQKRINLGLFFAVNDEVIKLKQRIAELERVNAQLTLENAALKGKPQKEAKQTGDKTRAILQFFFETPQSLTT